MYSAIIFSPQAQLCADADIEEVRWPVHREGTTLPSPYKINYRSFKLLLTASAYFFSWPSSVVMAHS